MTNDMFTGKPAWYKPYAYAIAAYVVTRDRVVVSAWNSQVSPLAQHMENCSVETLYTLDDDVEAYTESDSYDFTYASLSAYVSIRFTCACGEFVNAKATANETLGDVISGLTYTG